MATVLESIAFDWSILKKELSAFERLLSKRNLSERAQIQPFFKAHRHLASLMGTYAYKAGYATELCFEYDFFGDFKADLVVGSKQDKEFCVIEFEDGKQDTIFKKQPKRKNPEWSARLEHAFSQMADWF